MVALNKNDEFGVNHSGFDREMKAAWIFAMDRIVVDVQT